MAFSSVSDRPNRLKNILCTGLLRFYPVQRIATYTLRPLHEAKRVGTKLSTWVNIQWTGAKRRFVYKPMQKLGRAPLGQSMVLVATNSEIFEYAFFHLKGDERRQVVLWVLLCILFF